MNNSRRKRISKIADALNELKGQIDESFTRRSRKPSRTSLRACRGTERYEVAENAVDMLESASSGLEDVISFLGDAEG